MKTVLLMRHADPASVPLDTPDSLIPISENGKTKQKRVCHELKKIMAHIDTLYSSPFLRAIETAEVVEEIFQCEVTPLTALGFPFARDTVLALINSLPEKSTTCFVGHGPSLSWIARYLKISLPDIEIGRSCVAVININSQPPQLLTYIKP